MGEGCGRDVVALLGGLVIVVIILGFVAYLVMGAADGLFDSRSDQLHAQASLAQARAQIERERGEAKAIVERAKQDREHQQSVDWVREVEIYAITMKMFSNDKTTELIIAAGVIGAMSALLLMVGVEVFLRLKT